MYLKENIIDAGYDANAFGMFMASQKVNGTDINNWSLSELEELVLHFSQFVYRGENNSEVTQVSSNHTDSKDNSNHSGGIHIFVNKIRK